MYQWGNEMAYYCDIRYNKMQSFILCGVDMKIVKTLFLVKNILHVFWHFWCLWIERVLIFFMVGLEGFGPDALKSIQIIFIPQFLL